MTHSYLVTGMTCGNCQKKVQGLLSRVRGVESVSIDLANSKATIEMSEHIPIQTLQSALRDQPNYTIAEMPAAAGLPVEEKATEKKTWWATYRPILLIFGYIGAVSLILARRDGAFSPAEAMRVFMAGFFLQFSFFKLLDLRGFADSYSMYDLVAKHFRGWAYLYAFLELALGLSYAANFQLFAASVVSLVMLTISIAGVLQSVLNRRRIKCACLGAVFNLPMSSVTLFEDALMIAMSAAMLVIMHGNQ